MERNELMYFIFFTSLMLAVLLSFLLLVLLIQRKKSNRFIIERERLKVEFYEQLIKSQMEIQEQSFNTISMEIHDNVGQTLSLLNVQLNIIEQRNNIEKALVAEAKESARKAMNDLRDIARSLSSERIRSSSLAQITAQELNRLNQTGIMNAAFKQDGEEKFVQDEKKLILFRIIQECFQNTIKHSQAANISVTFNYGEESLQISIADDGQGFDPGAALSGQKMGLGLQNIIKRAEAISGKATIKSVPKAGTTVIIDTPYV